MLFVTDSTTWVNVRDIEAFEAVDEGQTRVYTRSDTTYVLNLAASDIAAALTQAYSNAT